MKIIRNISYLLSGFCLLIMAACTNTFETELPVSSDDAGDVTLDFTPQMKLFQNAKSRTTPSYNGAKWDHQEGYLDNMILFCFDSKGAYLAHRKAEITDASNFKMKVTVPGATRIIHFAGNCATSPDFQNIDDMKYAGVNEETFIPMLKMEYKHLYKENSASELLIPYWGRMKVTTKDELKQLGTSSRPVTLNPDMVVITWDYKGANYPGNNALVAGFVICNRHRYGSLAPFNNATRDDQNGPFVMPGFEGESTNHEVVKLTPPYDAILKDETEVSWTTQATFECGNTYDHQLFLILKYGPDLTGDTPAGDKFSQYSNKYVKIMLVDEYKTPIPLFRGHLYVVSFNGMPNPDYLYDTYDEAYNGDAANNPWFTIDDSTPSIGEAIDGKTRSLSIDKGVEQIFIYAGASTIDFTTQNLTDDELKLENIDVQWLEGGQDLVDTKPTVTSGKTETDLAGNKLSHFSINLHFKTPPARPTRRHGRLMLKVGKFIRRIDVYLQEPFFMLGRSGAGDKGIYFQHNTSRSAFDPKVRPWTDKQDNAWNPGVIELWMSYDTKYNPFVTLGKQEWKFKFYSNRLNGFKWNPSGMLYSLPIEVTQSPTFIIRNSKDGTQTSRTVGYNYHYNLTVTPNEYGGRPAVYFWMNSVQGDCPYPTECPYSKLKHLHLFMTADNMADVELVFDYQNNKSYLVNEGEVP